MRWLVLVSSMLVVGCPMDSVPSGDGIVCTEVFVYGINLTVRDVAGDPITGAVVTLTSGQYSETMMESSPGLYVGAGERAGTYSLLIEADGFGSETVADIVVNENECHVIPVALTVGLTAAG